MWTNRRHYGTDHAKVDVSMWIRKFILGLLLVVTLPGYVFAETVYVTDNLRIGLRPAPDNNAPPIGVVVSGMKLEVLKRSDDYVKVRSTDGSEGWIKEIHVTNEVPVRLQLEQTTSQLQQLKKDTDDKTSQLKTAQESAQQLSNEVEGLRKSNDSLQAELASMNVKQGRSWAWLWVTLVILIALGGGFYAGMVWHRQKVAEKLGGLRF